MDIDGGEGEPLTTTSLLPHQNVYEQVAAVESGNSTVTPLLLFSVFISVCGSFAYGSAVGYSSPIESAVMDDLGLSTAEFSLFGSMLTVGGMLGSLASGKISDLFGRRGVRFLCILLARFMWLEINMIASYLAGLMTTQAIEINMIASYLAGLMTTQAMGLSDTLGLLGWIAISISQEAWSLDLGRSLVGVSIGITVYVVPIYIAEITPKNLRGGFVSLSQLLTSFGLVVMFFTGSLIPWRILVLIGVVPSLLQLLGIFLIPESPRYLAKLGRNKEQETALQRLRGNNIDISQEVADIEEFTERLQQIPEVTFLSLFQRRYARAIIVVFGLMALAGIAGPSGVTFYASSVFKSAGFSSSIGSIVMALIQIPSTVIGVYLIDKCGRRPLLMISVAAMCLCCILVGFMFLMKENHCLQSISPYLIVLGIWGYSAAFPLGIAVIPFVIMSEIFPMNVKGSAGSLAAVVSSGSIWASSYTFNFMTEWSYPGTFFILGGLNAFTFVFAERLMPETKGKTLEEIQESLTPP